jgi:replicative DNA helicase
VSDELCDLEAERNVLGAVLMAPDVFIDVASTLRPDDFFRPAHETIWQAIAAQAASDEPVDPVLIMERLRAQGDLNRVGGPEYLHTLVSETASAANALYYARIVHRYGGVRRVQSAAMQIEQLARSSTGGDLDDLRQRASSAMDRAVDVQKPRGGWVYDTFPATLESLSEPARSIPSPWSELDRYIGGFSPGRLVVVGARPGVGKTAWALQSAMHTANQPGFSAAYASLEMTEEELHFRMLSQLGRVPYDRLERRGLGDRDWDQISGVTARMSAMRVNIMDTGSVRVHDVWHYVRGLNRRQRIGVVVVDYLQLMQSPNTKQPRHEVVADYSRQLKLMAKDQQVCVIACSQLNRASTSRRDGRPGLSDLRETGAIEQDADAVVLLHRDVDGERQTDMEFIIGKNRHGSTGIVKAEFIGRFQHIKQAEWSPHDTLD